MKLRNIFVLFGVIFLVGCSGNIRVSNTDINTSSMIRGKVASLDVIAKNTAHVKTDSFHCFAFFLDKPEDFVIATGKQATVRDFINKSANQLGIILRFEGEGLEEVGKVETIDATVAEQDISVKPGDIIVVVDKKYYRPTEVDNLLGDPSQAKEKLGWEPRVTLDEMVAESYLKGNDRLQVYRG